MNHFPPGGQSGIFVMPTNCHFLSSVFLIFSFLNYLWEAPTGSVLTSTPFPPLGVENSNIKCPSKYLFFITFMCVVLSKGNETGIQVDSKEVKNLDSVMPFIFSKRYKSQTSEIMCLGLQMLWSITDFLVYVICLLPVDSACKVSWWNVNWIF